MAKRSWFKKRRSYKKDYSITPSVEDNDWEGLDYTFEKTKTKKEETNWQFYQRTGVWRGSDYYQKSLVDYGYIEKMANAFASKFSITIETGSHWSSNVKDKKLIYEPVSLMKLPKARIIALLLHEVGHIKHTTMPTVNDSHYIKKYGNPAMEVFNAFEDFRIDEIMCRAYEGAGDVYEANIPVIKAIADSYREKSGNLKDLILQITKMVVQNVVNIPDAREKFEALIEKLGKRINLFDYLAVITCCGYGITAPTDGDVKEMIDKTKHAPALAKKNKNSLEVVKMMDKEVYPVIERLLEDIKEPQDVKDVFGEQVSKVVGSVLKRVLEEGYDRENVNSRLGDQKGSNDRAGDESVPLEWREGDYDSLRVSVDTAIKELVRKLTFLKKEEEVARYLPNQKRGRLHNKALYKHAVDNNRLFKKKLDSKDTVTSFAFSLVLDVSGSMQGDNKNIHSTRSLVMLAEVFEKMKIPYEITTFTDQAYGVKGFEETLSKKIKGKIGGTVNIKGGGTILESVFENGLALDKRLEKNKIMVLISDGDIYEGVEISHRRFMDRYKKRGIKFVGVGLNCGDIIKELCYGDGFVTDVPDKLPVLFSDLLKSLVLKKKQRDE